MSNLYSDTATAVLALLAGNAALTGKVFDGKVPDPTPAPPYVVVYLDFQSPKGATGDTLADKSITLTTRVYCHCVGADATAARAMAYQVRASLLSVRLSISGRTSELIGLDAAPPPQSDETTGVQVMDSVNVFRFATYPA